MNPWLSDEELAELCEPLEQPAAQIRYLSKVLKLHVERKPNGRALVMRTELERVVGASRLGMAAQNSAAGPNVVGLQDWAKRRRGHGAKTQG
jgi:hypothetical protein